MTDNINKAQGDAYNLKEFAIEGIFNRNIIKGDSYGYSLHGKNECYQSMYNFSQDVIGYMEEKRETSNDYSIRGYDGSVYCKEVILDIDCKDEDDQPDLTKAVADTLKIADHINKIYGVPSESMRINFSGYKGFHLRLPSNCFGDFEPSADLPQIIKRIVIMLTNTIIKVDLSVYDPIRLMRIENTINKKSGLYARSMTLEELKTSTIEELLMRAKSPAPTHQVTIVCEPLKELEAIKNAATEQVRTLSSNRIHKLSAGEISEQETNNSDDYDFSLYYNIRRNCAVLQTIEAKSKAGLSINNKERLIVASFCLPFGEAGRKCIHELLKNQKDYNPERTDYHYDEMAKNGYKPMRCDSICGEEKCYKIKAISKNSPIAFAKYEGNFQDQMEYVEAFSSYFKDQLLYVPREEEFYLYGNGVFKALPKNELNIKVSAFFNIFSSSITDTRINGIVKRLAMYEGIANNQPFNNNKYLINCENGVFDIRTGVLSPHSANYKATIQIHASYDPHAECPLFIKTLNEIFDNNEQKIDFLLQWFAYLLLPTYEYQKILILIGSGRNGKGILILLFSAILGLEHISNEKFSDLATDGGYNIVKLHSKLMNISSELSGAETDTDLLKKLSGGDYISAREIYKSRFNFINLARLVVLTNSMPRLSNIDYAMLKRFDIIEFTKSFADNPDTDLLSKLKKEKSGILNLILSKIPKILREDGSIKISSPINDEEIIDKYLPQFNSAAEWCRECTTFENIKDESLVDVSLTLLKDAYVHYKSWCTHSAGNKPVNKLRFKEILTTIMKVKLAKIPYLSFGSSNIFKNENWFIGLNINDGNQSHNLKRVDAVNKGIIN